VRVALVPSAHSSGRDESRPGSEGLWTTRTRAAAGDL